MPLEEEVLTSPNDGETLYHNFLPSYHPSARATERFSVKGRTAIGEELIHL